MHESIINSEAVGIGRHFNLRRNGQTLTIAPLYYIWPKIMYIHEEKARYIHLPLPLHSRTTTTLHRPRLPRYVPREPAPLRPALLIAFRTRILVLEGMQRHIHYAAEDVSLVGMFDALD